MSALSFAPITVATAGVDRAGHGDAVAVELTCTAGADVIRAGHTREDDR